MDISDLMLRAIPVFFAGGSLYLALRKSPDEHKVAQSGIEGNYVQMIRGLQTTVNDMLKTQTDMTTALRIANERADRWEKLSIDLQTQIDALKRLLDEKG